MIEFESIPDLNNLTKNRLIQIESVQAVIGEPIELNPNQLKQRIFNTVVMIEFVDNL